MIIRPSCWPTLAALVLLAVFSTTARADLVGWWQFEGNANDSSAFGNNGAFQNGAGLSGDVPPFIGAGQSLSLAGGNQHVLVPDSASLDIISDITIAAWVKPIGNVGFDGVVAKNPSDGSSINHAGNYEFRIENPHRRMTFHHQRGGVDDTQAYDVPTSSAVGANTWSHVAVTASNGGDVTFFLNGTPVGATGVIGTFGAANNNPLIIGSRADLFTTMDGLIDDLRIYDEVISNGAILALAGGAPPTPTAPVVNVVASSEFTGDGRLAIHAVNGNGLLGGGGHVNNPPGGNMWLTAGAGDTAPFIGFDLGAVQTLNEVRIWNYNENANPTCCLVRGIAQMDILVAGEDGVFTPHIAGQTLAIAPGTATDFSEIVNLGGVEARYVMFTNTANHGDASFTGLSEVQFDGAPAGGVPASEIPLPATIHSVSSNLSGFDRLAEYTVNGNGKFANRHTIAPEGNMWLNQGTFGGTPTPDLDPEITFDLGEELPLDRIKVWNYNEVVPGNPGLDDTLLGRGVASANILVAGEDLIFTPVLLNVPFSRAPGAEDVDFDQQINLGGVVARYVKIDILSNHNGRTFPIGVDDQRDNFAGLSEVQFFVPEPGSALLLALGSVTMAFGRRRRGR